MINSIKNNIKLLKYGYQFKLNVISSVIFILLGTFLISYGNNIYKSPSMYMIFFCSFIFIVQLAYTLTVSGIVKSSPKYRQFYLGIPRLVNITGFLISFLLLLIIKFIKADTIEDFMQYSGNEVASAGIMYMVTFIYIALAYKFFVISVIIFCGSCFGINILFNYITEIYNFTLVQGIGIAVLFVIIGLVLFEILERVTYKIQMSKFAQSAFLRRYM